MEEAVVATMSTGMMMLIGTLLFWFRKTIFRAAELSEISVTRLLDGVDDSSGTYVAKLHIMNAKTRADLAKEISELELIVSNDDIMSMLQNKQQEPVKKTKATAAN